MRRELFWNPLLLLERIGEISTERRRLNRLRGTPAEGLTKDHIGSLELLELVARESFDVRIIYDVGSNAGTWARLARTFFPRCEIHMFEPLPEYCEVLWQLSEQMRDLHFHPIALGSENRQMVMHVQNFSDASSLLLVSKLGADRWQLSEKQQIPVPVECLDDRIANLSLPWPDFLKLDVQGYELQVLRGAKKAIANCSAILTEVSFESYYEDQCLFHDLIGYLALHGFRLRAFGDGIAAGEALGQVDALFIRSS